MRILLFAHLQDVAGRSEIELALGEPVDGAEIWRRLLAVCPALGRFRGSVRLARNCEYVGPEAQFSDADELALIPPVSGG